MNGLAMIVALVKDEIITYSKIYNSFDRINIFETQWERNLKEKLSNLQEGIIGLQDLMYEVNDNNVQIINAISYLGVTFESNINQLKDRIDSELKGIGSSLKTNNLLSAIQSYQLYKLNKNTKRMN